MPSLYDLIGQWQSPQPVYPSPWMRPPPASGMPWQGAMSTGGNLPAQPWPPMSTNTPPAPYGMQTGGNLPPMQGSAPPLSGNTPAMPTQAPPMGGNTPPMQQWRQGGRPFLQTPDASFQGRPWSRVRS